MMYEKSQGRRQAPHTYAANQEPENDLIWGAEDIGKEINRTAGQVYYLNRIGVLKGAVRKLAHRTLVGSRAKLRALTISE